MWVTQNDVPSKVGSNVVRLNNHTLIFASAAFANTFDEKKHGIWKYDTIEKEWTLLAKYPNGIIPTTFHNICYDEENKKVFIQGYEQKMIEYDCCNEQFIVYNLNEQIGSYPSPICINSKLNIIGGASNRHHLIWNHYNDDKMQFTKMHKFKDWKSGNYGAGIVHLKKKRQLLFFGGYDFSVFAKLDCIWIYEMDKAAWKKSKCLMPLKMNMFGYVISSDERYLVTFGGDTKKRKEIDEIWVLDFETMLWAKSKIKCPMIGCFNAVSVSNRDSADLCVYGWCRKDTNMPILPGEILQLICQWYQTETVHLFLCLRNFHWTINLNDILQDVQVKKIQLSDAKDIVLKELMTGN